MPSMRVDQIDPNTWLKIGAIVNSAIGLAPSPGRHVTWTVQGKIAEGKYELETLTVNGITWTGNQVRNLVPGLTDQSSSGIGKKL